MSNIRADDHSTIGSRVRTQLRAPLLAALVLLSYRAATAHPHVFIDVKLKFVLSDTALDGFYVYWEFDPMNSAGILMEFDKNRDKRIDTAEARVLRREAFEHAAEDNYFMSCICGLQRLEVKGVERFRVSVSPKHILTYSFYVPCNIAIETLEGTSLGLFFEDPSMYIAFTLCKNMVQASSTPRATASIRFDKLDYVDRAILTVTRAAP